MPPQILSSLSTCLKLKYARPVYQYVLNSFVALILLPALLLILSIQLIKLGPDETLAIWNCLTHFDLITIFWSSFLVIFVSTLFYMSKPHTVYLVDFACFKAPADFRVSFNDFAEHSKVILSSAPKSVDFQLKILEHSGLGEETSLPLALHEIPPDPTMKDTWEEAEMVIFYAMDSLFQKCGLGPQDIDVLVVNSTIWFPSPSLSSMVINKYKLKDSVKSFDLHGMGCSASLISIKLVRDLLQAYPSYIAVVVSVELMTTIYYKGKERSMLVPNCLFQMGGAAVLLSTRKSFCGLKDTADDDKSYNCVCLKEDPEGILGVWLSKELLAVAGEALTLNLTVLGHLVLPASEKLLYAVNSIARKVFSIRWSPYIPNFKQAFEHFCIHAGGRAVIDGVQDSLQLSAEQVEASRSTLHRFGNTSSSSLWYEMSYIEAKGRMKKGDRILQISFGSGYKCNSAVWKCTETVKTLTNGPWSDCIDNYPACIPRVPKLLRILPCT